MDFRTEKIPARLKALRQELIDNELFVTSDFERMCDVREELFAKTDPHVARDRARRLDANRRCFERQGDAHRARAALRDIDDVFEALGLAKEGK